MSGLLIPNTFDPRDKVVGIAKYTGSAASTTLVNITGRGILTSLAGQNYGTGNSYSISIVADGVTVTSGEYNPQTNHRAITPFIAFNNSLVITVTSENSSTHTTIATYLLD